MRSFINAFMEFTATLETPSSFWRWASFVAVGATLRDNVYIPQGQRTGVYPNLYVLLLAESAISRKSGPVGVVGTLIAETKRTKLIRGRSSIQAVLQDLASQEMDKNTGMITAGGSCLLAADELASFLVTDPATVPILTDIYDYRDEWTSNLKGGKFMIKGLCVSMLAASNETHLREVYSNLAIYGGLMGRTFFIKPDEKRPPNSLFGLEDTEAVFYDQQKAELKALLMNISQLRGKMRQDQDAKDEYIKWYTDLYNRYGNRPDKSGIIARIHTGVLKISMVLAIGHTYELNIKKEHIEEAIDRTIAILPNYELFVLTSGKSDISNAGALLFNKLFDSPGHKITRKLFLREFWTECDAETLDKLVGTLESAGLLKAAFDENMEVEYKLTEAGVDRIKEKLDK